VKDKIKENTKIVSCEKSVSSKIDDEEIILNINKGTYYGLDPIGARIWDLIQDPVTVDALVNRLLEEYDVGREQCLEDVLALLHDMCDEELVDVVE